MTMVASALPKDGKSFVASNLAQVLSRQQGRRVLLIDGDMRMPSLHSALGTSSTPGLGDYLLGEVDELSAIQRGPMENLFFLPSGRTVDLQPLPYDMTAQSAEHFLLGREPAPLGSLGQLQQKSFAQAFDEASRIMTNMARAAPLGGLIM